MIDRQMPDNSAGNEAAAHSRAQTEAAHIRAIHGGQNQHVHVYAVLILSLLAFVAAIVEIILGETKTWEVLLMALMFVLSILGITVGFHRLLAHRAFETGPVLKALLSIWGSMAAQGPPIYWVSNHRRHHRFSDQPGDPHSPFWIGDQPAGNRLRGWWHAHLGWLFTDEVTNTTVYGKDLFRDPVIVWVNRRYHWWLLLSLAIPAAIGAMIEQSALGMWKGLLWGGGVRLFLSYHATQSINSICHLFGFRSFDTREQSTNNVWFAIPTLGEAWHNNHHACPGSAIFGVRWWQIDIGGYFIRLCEFAGLAKNVVRHDPVLLKSFHPVNLEPKSREHER